MRRHFDPCPAVTAALAAAALAGCRPQPPAADAPPGAPVPPPASSPAPAARPPADSALPAPSAGDLAASALVRLHTAARSGFAEPAELVVREAARWPAVWATVAPRLSGAAPPAPAVDFAREMVVVVAAGERPSGGYAIRVDAVDAVDADGAGAVVRYTLTAPGPGCLATQALTSPVEVVRVPRVAGPVRFAARRAAAAC